MTVGVYWVPVVVGRRLAVTTTGLKKATVFVASGDGKDMGVLVGVPVEVAVPVAGGTNAVCV